MSTVIFADSSSDLPLSFIENNNIPYCGLICHMNDGDYVDDFGKTLHYEDFYRRLRAYELPTTSQINIYLYMEKFKSLIEQGHSIIYLCFSSGLSGCYNNAVIAREMLIEDYKNADITIIDTKSASIGQGLLIYYANDMLKNGCSNEEIVNWVEENKLYVNHWFAVDSLTHLKHGGRISATAATVGTLLDIKPIISMNDDGQLVHVSNVRGFKKSLNTLITMFEDRIISPETQVIGITHGDSPQHALYLKETLEKKYNVKGFLINPLGPVIGSHTGPGMLSLSFLGRERVCSLKKIKNK